MAQTCPICKSKTNQLFPLDAQLKQYVKKIGKGKELSKICSNCYKKLSKKISGSMGGKTKSVSSHNRNRALIWRSRTALLKKAHKLFEQKIYSRAITNFEKYLRIIEAANGKKEGELTPEVFSKSIRSKELTVITSVYWKLLRIYDMNTKYEKQMFHAAEKLAMFLPYSYIYNEIMRKSKSLIKAANNPTVFKRCFKSAKKSHKRCFIATSAFCSSEAPEVILLRQFKHHYLEKKRAGRWFIDFYNKTSPSFAECLDRYPMLKPFIRQALRCLIYFLPLNYKRKRDHFFKKTHS